jgi:thioredoxin reductase (NADPH)
VAVVGGGDTAMEEAIYLSKLATTVTVIHRRDTLRASKVMQDKAGSIANISFIWNTEVVDIGDVEKGEVTRLMLKHVLTDERSELPIDGVFIAIGHVPNTKMVKGQLTLDEGGYIITYGGTRTSVPGVFAAGDVQDHVYRQAVTAAGSGCMAAIDAERFLSGLSHDAATREVASFQLPVHPSA